MHDSKSRKQQWGKSNRIDDDYGGGIRGVVGDGFELDDGTYRPDEAEKL